MKEIRPEKNRTKDKKNVEEKEKIAQEMLTEASKHQDFQLIKTIIEQQQQLLQIKQQLKKLLGRVF